VIAVVSVQGGNEFKAVRAMLQLVVILPAPVENTVASELYGPTMFIVITDTGERYEAWKAPLGKDVLGN
jgi:hypothetical protein